MEGTVIISLTDYEKLKRRAELSKANEDKLVALSMKVYDHYTDLISGLPMSTSRDQVASYFKGARHRAEESIRKNLE